MKNIMVYTKHSKLNGRGFTKVLKENSTLLVFSSFLVCGLLMGSSLYDTMPEVINEKIIGLFTGQTPVSEYIRIILISSVLCGLCCFYGAGSCFGLPVISGIPFYIGFCHAVILSQLLKNYKITGLAYYALIILPGGLFRTVSMLALCEFSAILSREVASQILFKEKTTPNIKKYSFYALLSTGITGISVLINMITNHLFSGLFL